MPGLVTKVDQRATPAAIVGEAHTIGEDVANVVLLDEVSSIGTVVISGYTRVSGIPAAGQFKVSPTKPDLVEFNAADNGDAVLISYTGLGSYIRSRDINRIHEAIRQLSFNIRDFGAKGDGVADDTAAIQSAIDLAAAAGGTVYVPPVLQFYRVTQLNMKSRVIMEGAGYASHIRNIETGYLAANEPILFGNYHPAMLGQITTYSLNDIVAGARSITFDIAADAANFAVGDIPVVAASNDIAGNSPDSQFINKVMAVDVGAGTIELEFPIPVAVTNPIIGRIEGTDTATGNPRAIIENAGLRNLRISSAESIWCSRAGAYKSLWECLWVEGARVLSVNGLAHCTVRTIRGIFEERFFEAADGCWNTLFEDITVSYRDNGFTETNQPIISIGDCYQVTLQDFLVNADDFSAKVSIQILKTSRAIVRRGSIRCPATTGVLFTNAGVDVDIEDCEINDVDFRMGTPERFIYFNDQGGAGIVRRAKLLKLQFFGVPTARAVEVNMGEDCDFDISSQAGDIRFAAGTTRNRLILRDRSEVAVVTDNGTNGLPIAYTATNVVTDRTFNANATTVDELADVLGTLIADLRARGLVK